MGTSCASGFDNPGASDQSCTTAAAIPSRRYAVLLRDLRLSSPVVDGTFNRGEIASVLGTLKGLQVRMVNFEHNLDKIDLGMSKLEHRIDKMEHQMEHFHQHDINYFDGPDEGSSSQLPDVDDPTQQLNPQHQQQQLLDYLEADDDIHSPHDPGAAVSDAHAPITSPLVLELA